MPTIPLFQGGSYLSDSPNWSADRTVNLFTEVGESGATKTPARLRGTPGLKHFCTLPTSPVRGIWVYDPAVAGTSLNLSHDEPRRYRIFAVAGSRFYDVFIDGTFLDRGDVGDDATHTPVQMFANGRQLMIVSAGSVYIDNGSGAQVVPVGAIDYAGTVDVNGTAVDWVSGDQFSQTMVGGSIILNLIPYQVVSVSADNLHLVIATDAGNWMRNHDYNTTSPLTARTGTFLDSYYIVNPPFSAQFNISAPYEGMVWDPLDFGVKQGYSDSISSVFSDHEELWLMGTETIEIWRNTGNADFPFERDLGAFIHQGCIAAYSVVRLNNGVAWLGGDTRGRVIAWRAQGFMPVRISTHAVESAWAAYPEVADAFGFAYRLDGHELWQITFPTADKTWEYDALTNLWHEKDSFSAGDYHRHRASCHGALFGRHFVGSADSGDIFEMSSAFYDDAGAPIRRMRVCPHLSHEQLNQFFHKLQLDLETGSGVADPEFTLEWSNDGGHTWPGSVTVTAGNLNDFTKRVIWWRLGMARDRVFRIWSTAAIPHTWMNAIIETTPGVS